jgi:hypothetical protein
MAYWLAARGEVAEPGLRRTPGERVNSEGFGGSNLVAPQACLHGDADKRISAGRPMVVAGNGPCFSGT